jgi:hypothetical protein
VNLPQQHLPDEPDPGETRLLEQSASERFCFRFVVRGEKAGALLRLSVESLLRCHPRAEIVVVNANDEYSLHDLADEFAGEITVISVVPDDDEIARLVGRGSRTHLFYWRHSPQVLEALPASEKFAVYSDADIMYLRPMDLSSLVGPLSTGRIAAAVDESTITYYGRIGAFAAGPTGGLPAAGGGGPLLQAGLVFSNPLDDGGLYDRFWKLAVDAASAGHLPDLPYDDMCLLAALLGQGGPLWERLLPLGHEWNYITDGEKDPGVFGCAAHYGGHRAKALLLQQSEANRMSSFGSEKAECWGSLSSGDVEIKTLTRGTWPFHPAREGFEAWANTSPTPVSLPFALSWPAPPDAKRFTIRTTKADSGNASQDAMYFVYLDGRLADRFRASSAKAEQSVLCADIDVVSVVAVASNSEDQVFLEVSFW